MDIQKFKSDPVLRELIRTNKFVPEQYERVNRCQWANEFPNLKVRDIKHSLALKTPSIVLLRRYTGEKASAGVVSSFVNDLCSKINVNNSMTPHQIMESGKFLIDNFPRITVSDLRLCFNNAILCKYKNSYGRLDIQVISQWLTEYWEERMNTAATDTQEKSELHKKGIYEDDLPVNKKMIAEITAFRDSLIRKGKIKKVQEVRREGVKIVDDRTEEQKIRERQEMEAEIRKYQELKNKEMYDNMKNQLNKIKDD